MTSRQHDIEVLNDLIDVTLDSAYGYTDAVKETKNPYFKTLFGRRGIEREHVTEELQTEVGRLLGAQPVATDTASAKAHRISTNLKSALTGSDTGIVKTIESGEDFIKGEYEKALADRDLSPPVSNRIRNAFSSIAAGHDEMRNLKHHMKN